MKNPISSIWVHTQLSKDGSYFFPVISIFRKGKEHNRYWDMSIHSIRRAQRAQLKLLEIANEKTTV